MLKKQEKEPPGHVLHMWYRGREKVHMQYGLGVNQYICNTFLGFCNTYVVQNADIGNELYMYYKCHTYVIRLKRVVGELNLE